MQHTQQEQGGVVGDGDSTLEAPTVGNDEEGGNQNDNFGSYDENEEHASSAPRITDFEFKMGPATQKDDCDEVQAMRALESPPRVRPFEYKKAGQEMPDWIERISADWHGCQQGESWGVVAWQMIGKRGLTLSSPVQLRDVDLEAGSLMVLKVLKTVINQAIRSGKGQFSLALYFLQTEIRCGLQNLIDFVASLLSQTNFDGDLNLSFGGKGSNIGYSDMASMVHTFRPHSLSFGIQEQAVGGGGGLDQLLQACYAVTLQQLVLNLSNPNPRTMRELVASFTPLHNCLEKVRIRHYTGIFDEGYQSLTDAVAGSVLEESSVQEIELELFQSQKLTKNPLPVLSHWLGSSLCAQTFRLIVRGKNDFFTATRESQIFLMALQRCKIPNLHLRVSDATISHDSLVKMYQALEGPRKRCCSPLSVSFQGNMMLVPATIGPLLQSLGKMDSVKHLHIVDAESSAGIDGEQVMAAIQQNSTIQKFDIDGVWLGWRNNHGLVQRCKAVYLRNKAISHVAQWVEARSEVADTKKEIDQREQEQQPRKEETANQGSGGILAPILYALSRHDGVEDSHSLQADPFFRLLRHEVRVWVPLCCARSE